MYGEQPDPSDASGMATPHLSEDVSSLLRWGRHVLQEQREQRRQSPRISSSAAVTKAVSGEYPNGKHRPTGLNSSSALLPSSSSYITEASHNGSNSDSLSHSFLSAPPLHTQQFTHELRARLAQLEAVEADNARIFEQHFSLLQRGRDRLARLHDPAATAQRERYVKKLMSTVQALVEGEEVARDTLREVEDRLVQTQRRQAYRISANVPSSSVMVTVSSGAHAEGESHEEDAALVDVVRRIKQRAQEVVDTHARQQEDKAAKEMRRQAVLRQRAEAEETLRRRLQKLESEVQRLSEVEKQRLEEVEEMKAQRAAQVQATALQEAAARRRQAIHEVLQRCARLQEEAILRNAVAQQELAASDACREEKLIAYNMALRELNVVEEALLDARRQHRHAQRRKEDAEAELDQLRQAVAAVEQRGAEMRAQRLACEEDSEALAEVIRGFRLRHTHHVDLSFSSRNAAGADGSASYCPEERFAALQRGLPALKQQLKACEDEVAGLLKENAEGLGRLLHEEKETAALQAQKAALEAYLVREKPPALA
ncbi:hypothetical protein ABL78_4001 [Leptomonas seymouri]|uniref:Uncharacterized protein n=1 Tax=Leptomonas seymouri TaxID=5684 RepID=A0A0N1IL10_LEPSE|nr:hypothetical protein ABL78_4001 [Leptomonas seymouri]|eukprot:KPI86955.1 hypothetical protein ABL78_4001 [Leptomonas seymouri]